MEYGDYECPYCGQAEVVIRELLDEFGDELRYVWRHLPLNDVHTHAQMAAEATEAAGAQGEFWPMHDRLLADQEELDAEDLRRTAEELGLDSRALLGRAAPRKYAERVGEDVASADASGVAGTPSSSARPAQVVRVELLLRPRAAGHAAAERSLGPAASVASAAI